MTAGQEGQPSFTCPVCGAVSYHPQDVAHEYCGRCGTFPENRPAGLKCPGCGEPPRWLMDNGRQAFCGTDPGCPIIMWDPTLSLADMPVHTIEWP